MVFRKKFMDKVILLVARTFCLVSLVCGMFAALFNTLGEINFKLAQKMFWRVKDEK